MLAKKYRRKPIIVEAVKFEYTESCLSFLKQWMGLAFGDHEKSRHPNALGELQVRTLEDGKLMHAKHIATEGDFIVKGVNGEFWPVKPNIFKQTYTLDEHYMSLTEELNDGYNYELYN